MKKLFVLVVLLLLVVAGTSALLGVAQNDTATASTSVSNNAVFIGKVDDFGLASDVVIADVEAGKRLLGTAKFNVDATSTYGLSAVVTGGSVVGTTLFGTDCDNANCPYVLSLDGGADAKGDVGVSKSGNAPTSGGLGTDFNLTATLCFSAPFACLADAPNGAYTFIVTVTVTD